MTNSDKEQLNPWVGLWFQTRKAFRHILHTSPTRLIIWLALIGGIISSLSWLSFLWTEYPDRPELRQSLSVLVSLVFGALLALVHLYFGGWLYRLTGSWLGGKGTYTEVKCAIGWSYYPFALANIANIIIYFVFSIPILQIALSLINLILLVWGIVIFVKMIAEAHQFSSSRPLGTLILGALLIFVVLMLISLLVPLLTPLFTN